MVALCSLPTEKMNLEKTVDFLTKSQAKSDVKVVANGVYTAKLETKNHIRRRKRERLAVWLLTCECGCECITVQCTMQRVQPDRGHHCGSKCNKRYDSTGLLTDNSRFIYRY